MNENIRIITREDDDNARDEFSAAHFFKNNAQNRKPSSTAGVLKRKLGDVTNILSEGFPNKNRNFSHNQLEKKTSESDAKKHCLESFKQPENRSVSSDTIKVKWESSSNVDIKHDIMRMDFEESGGISTINHLFEAFKTPASGYNAKYERYIVVPPSIPNARLMRAEKSSAIGKRLMTNCKIQMRSQWESLRLYCSPPDQYYLTPESQYKSVCLINSHFSSDGIPEKLVGDFALEKMNEHPQNNYFKIAQLNHSYFHELLLEKLPANQVFDFMPSSRELTGAILGGFINFMFEVSIYAKIHNEIIHTAVDYLYQYLSRVQDVPVGDLKWLSLSCVWLAAKYSGFNLADAISKFAGCSLTHLRKAELRIAMVADFNFTKSHAFNFRNRYVSLESSNSTIKHMSSFILDMSLHCYTLMLQPSSKRAAAAIWLARLIDTFVSVKFNHNFWSDTKRGKELMNSVWPERFVTLTGYSHRDISLLAMKMHVVIIVFLTDCAPEYPPTSACLEKYSSMHYGGLTQSYEKFTARCVFSAFVLYCNLIGLQLSTYLAKNEFEILTKNYHHNQPQLRRSISLFNGDEASKRLSFDGGNSCPPLLTNQPIIPRPLPIDATKDDNVKELPLRKFDSGYSTSSNIDS